MNIDQALPTFVSESRELLEELEQTLLSFTGGEPDAESINAVFRAAHTIKGSAGLFGLDHIVAFTHVAESVLDQVRGEKIGIDDTLIALMLACCDHIGALIDTVESGKLDQDDAIALRGVPLIEQLRAIWAKLPG